MRASVTHRSVAAPTPLAAFLGGVLVLAGCSSPSTPAAAPTTKPSASAAPAVRFEVPAEVHGLPRSTAAEWLKVPKSTENSLKGKVLTPTSSVAAAYLDPDDLSEIIELSAAAGRVGNPASTLNLLTMGKVNDLEDVRPADTGTAGGVATCGVSRELRPAVITICDWAEPGSVGWVRITSLKDRRAWFTDLRKQLSPG